MGGALVVYGLGGDTGNFGAVAATHAAELLRRGLLVHSENVTRKRRFFELLRYPPFRHRASISELHVFCHSIGAAIFLGYGDRSIENRRREALSRALTSKPRRNVTFDEVIEAEVGAVFTDDLSRPIGLSGQAQITANFGPRGFAKFWGCNTARSGWVYSDYGVTDVRRTEDALVWWRALNAYNNPKPSFARAFANYIKRPVFGSASGTHLEVLVSAPSGWQSTEEYRAQHRKWPSGRLIRLTPDRGTYIRHDP